MHQIRPVGQAVKTPPSHGGIRSSILLRVTTLLDEEAIQKNIAGANGDEVTPVPIPNTEVKLISVEDTWLATAWENRAAPAFSFQHLWAISSVG